MNKPKLLKSELFTPKSKEDHNIISRILRKV